MDYIYGTARHSLGVALHSGSGGLCRICKPNYHTYEGVLWGGRLPRLLLIAVVIVVVVVAAAIVVFLFGAFGGFLVATAEFASERVSRNHPGDASTRRRRRRRRRRWRR